jgi:hypothetical protein
MGHLGTPRGPPLGTHGANVPVTIIRVAWEESGLLTPDRVRSAVGNRCEPCQFCSTGSKRLCASFLLVLMHILIFCANHPWKSEQMVVWLARLCCVV